MSPRLTTVILAAALAAAASHVAVHSDAGAQQTGAPGMTGAVYTADETGNSISAIDLASGRVTTVPLTISPHNAQITADGARLLAVGEPAAVMHGHSQPSAGHAAQEREGLLVVLDSRALGGKPLATIRVGGHPAHVVADRAGRRAFVTLSGDNRVAEVDLARRTVMRTVATDRYPHGLRLSPDDRELYVANVEGGSVSVIDTGTLKEAARIPVGKAPVQVGFTPDGSRVYVSLRDENSVAVINTARRSVTEKIRVGDGPIQVHATPDGRHIYVANQGSEAAPGDTVSIIEVATGQVTHTVRTGKGAHGVAVSDNGRFVFITNTADATVSAIDASARKVVATYRVGRGPNGVTFRAIGKLALRTRRKTAMRLRWRKQ
ncbi:MAG: YncE family protein [Alphaproteobacteria bacterium]|nr:YncE family protein [Alphaproteobacteria bacterium]